MSGWPARARSLNWRIRIIWCIKRTMRRSNATGKMRGARLGADSGTALTELAIIAPMFILIVMWSEFFWNVGLVKLKVEEAARFTTWEMTAQREPAMVADEVQDRFQDLESPVSIH